MAPSPEYDKEPKAPDKSVVSISSDDSKVLYNHTKEQPTITDQKSAVSNNDVENKHVETLDDGQLRALLDEAITYKCPKDREGKSSLFKELLEEVEQDEEACEAAARGGGRGGRRARGREHHSSLQDLVAAMAAEPAPRRRAPHAAHHAPHAHASVSARAIHGGSLPSGVDTSFLLSEEPTRGGYLATVRCVNPPPLAERRVSASDAAPPDLELVTRRSKTTFPMTYTARATLEIGSGSVCSGRAVTTTTASNQVCTTTRPRAPRAPPAPRRAPSPPPPPDDQTRLMNALRTRDRPPDSGGIAGDCGAGGPRGSTDERWRSGVHRWYRSLDQYSRLRPQHTLYTDNCLLRTDSPRTNHETYSNNKASSNREVIFDSGPKIVDAVYSSNGRFKTVKQYDIYDVKKDNKIMNIPIGVQECKNRVLNLSDSYERDIRLRKIYRDRVGNDLVVPDLSKIVNPKNVRSMTIGKPPPVEDLEFKNNDNDKPENSLTEEPKTPRKLIDSEIEEVKSIHAPMCSSHDCHVTTESDPKTELDNKECIQNEQLDLHNTYGVVSEKQNELKSLLSTMEILDCVNVETVTRDDDKGSYLVLDNNVTVQLKTQNNEAIVLDDLPNNSYVFLTFPEDLINSTVNINRSSNITEIRKSDDPSTAKDNDIAIKKSKRKNKNKKKDEDKQRQSNRKDTSNKSALELFLYSDYSKKDDTDIGVPDSEIPEVDSAIPFSCITTPEVVASCNTTSTAQTTVAVDPKQQPRSVLTSTTFSGLPLARPGYGAAACSAADDYKKSLDENGNAVHGFGSPVSGSSQHKKPRRKKSSKNETVIKSHQIDGYQGNKDINEVLRFIESNADGARAHKMGRKHKDDCDDKGKKRSAERRKDKGAKLTRASSLEELSRTKLEDLTAKGAPAKPERRSWGDDARLVPDDELTDFQTVTKRRRPRRRADEPPAPRPPRAPRASLASPSAPHSERSDSNDDGDSVHSLPADAPQSRPRPAAPAAPLAPLAPLAPPAPPAPPPHASYADIARTRHNIPDLIESCNFYAEGDGDIKPELPPPNPKTSPIVADADGYPALAARRARDKPATGARPRKDKIETRGGDMPAPDVVADRRPPVILLDSAARPRDMDGVTFGFDINEQLLGGSVRRPHCDLLRDAPGGGAATGAGAGGGGGEGAGGLAVRAGCAALRYVPPDPPADTAHLHQIIDYVGTAWEDVVRCGGGKVRYFSE